MFLLRCSFLLLLTAALWSCKKDNERVVKIFYDIDSLLTVQKKYLSETKSVLFKKADLGGQLDSIQVKDLDTTGWLKEFEIFRQLDLNKKPINRENYTIRNDIPDPYSNLLICEYTAKSELPVKKVKIYYHGKLSNPRKIEGEFTEQNGLYTSNRKMVMELNSVNGRTLVTRYEVTGGQKMILGDSVEFRITGILIH